jgi:hypothetical protein
MHDIISEAEQSRRSLQEAINRLSQAVEKTLDLIARTEEMRLVTTDPECTPGVVDDEPDASAHKGAA